jgi:hypothetical protein
LISTRLFSAYVTKCPFDYHLPFHCPSPFGIKKSKNVLTIASRGTHDSWVLWLLCACAPQAKCNNFLKFLNFHIILLSKEIKSGIDQTLNSPCHF